MLLQQTKFKLIGITESRLRSEKSPLRDANLANYDIKHYWLLCINFYLKYYQNYKRMRLLILFISN